MSFPNHYRTLGVKRLATAHEIRAAYLTLSKIHHPDTGGSAEEFAKYAEAYKVLTTPHLAFAYGSQVDALGHSCKACVGTGLARKQKGFSVVHVDCAACDGTGINT